MLSHPVCGDLLQRPQNSYRIDMQYQSRKELRKDLERIQRDCLRSGQTGKVAPHPFVQVKKDRPEQDRRPNSQFPGRGPPACEVGPAGQRSQPWHSL